MLARENRIDQGAAETDAKLVAALRRGDSAAFDAAYERYRARLFGFLVRMSGDRHLAEDLLQESWIRLARNATRLVADTNLRAWLFTVARNLYLTHRRRASLYAHHRAGLDRGPASPSPVTPLEAAEGNESARALERAIARLEPKYREVVLLVGVEAMSPSEVATVLGESRASIRKRLSRARAMLREELPDE